MIAAWMAYAVAVGAALALAAVVVEGAVRSRRQPVRFVWLVGVGGLLNLIAIAANGGVMPAVAFDWQSGGDSRGQDPKPTAQLQRCRNESELIYFIRRQLFKKDLLNEHHTLFGQEIGMHRHPVVCSFRRESLEAKVIGAKQHDFLFFDQPLDRVKTDARILAEKFARLFIMQHLTSPDENNVALLQAGVLPLQRELEIVRINPVVVREGRHTFG